MKHNATQLVLMIWLVLSSSIVFADETFIISGNSYAPPVVWEEHNRLAGVAPDLIAEILDELSIPYSVRIIENWGKVQSEAQAGKIDLIVSAYRTEERESYLNFSIPYLPEPSVIVVKRGNEFPFASWSALKGKKGVAGIGESFGQEFDTYSKNNLDISYFQFERAIQELALGNADYLIMDFYTSLVYTYLLQGENAVTVLKPSIGTENFHFAIRKDSALNDHLDEINRVLGEKIAAGVVTELFMKHYDKWKGVIEQQSQFFNKLATEQNAGHQAYLKEEGEAARQSIMNLMVDREGLPAAAR